MLSPTCRFYTINKVNYAYSEKLYESLRYSCFNFNHLLHSQMLLNWSSLILILYGHNCKQIENKGLKNFVKPCQFTSKGLSSCFREGLILVTHQNWPLDLFINFKENVDRFVLPQTEAV